MTTENIVSKVQKLLRLSTSSNANEAALAAAKAQELIDSYNLSAAMLALDDAEPMADEPIVDFQKAGAPLDSQKQQQRWRAQLAVTISRLNGCRIYLHGGDIALVGRPSDAETVRYLFGYLSRQVEILASACVGMGKTWRNNFRLGVVETISRKLHEQRKAFEQEVRHVDNQIALMRVDRALATIKARGETVDSFIKGSLKLRKGAAYRTRVDSSARQAGRIAGQSVQIGGARGSLTSAAKKLCLRSNLNNAPRASIAKTRHLTSRDSKKPCEILSSVSRAIASVITRMMPSAEDSGIGIKTSFNWGKWHSG